MSKQNSNILYRLVNVWFAFNALLLLASYLPHWSNIPLLTWINESFFFGLLLLSVSIFLKEKHNKDIYLNLSLFIFVQVISIVSIFMGDDFLFGNNYSGYYVVTWYKIISSFLFNFVIVYIVFKYLFANQKTWLRYAACFALVFALLVINFFPYIRNPRFIFTLGNSYFVDISRRVFLNYNLSLFFIVLYGYLLYKTDKIIGIYINSLLAILFIFLMTDMADWLSQIYQFRIFIINQYVLTINLILLSVILFKKLFFLSSEYGQFYENLISNNIKLGKVKIQRHRGEINAYLLRFIKFYFYHRRHYLFWLSLVTAILFAYFQSSKFLTLNMTAILVCITTIFAFINALYKKRAKRKFTLP